MSTMLQPQIILLKEGTDTSQGKPQLISNINACTAVADAVRSTLGPRGMDKLIHDDKGNTTISNDGATIMKLLEIVHPAAKILVDIAKSQDSEVGDGTTTVVLLAGEFLKEAKPFIEDGVHPQNLIRSYRTASHLAIEKIKELALSIEGKSLEEKKGLLAKCAETTLASKLIGGEKEFFASMVVEAVISIGNDDRLNMIGIKKVPGGTMRDSFLVDGVAFKKTFSYAGFEQQPKKFVDPKILLLNIELELKSEKENAEIRLSDPSQYQSIVDAEWNIIYDKLDKCVASGAKIVLSRLAIGDLATQYFADRDIFCAGRVTEEDLQRVAAATGGTVQTSVNNVIGEVLGSCALFEEKQVGNERFNIFSGCPSGRTATIVLRGGADQFIEEAERSLHDAIMIVRRALKNSNVVAGGGAIDMEISRYLRQHARTIAGKSQLFINSYAKALEVIPRQLCDNAGFDATDVLNKLRQKHALPSGEGALYGVDINTGGIADSYANFVWEPSVVKINAINAATEAACLVLSVDETVKNPKSESAQGDAAAMGMGGRGRGKKNPFSAFRRSSGRSRVKNQRKPPPLPESAADVVAAADGATAVLRAAKAKKRTAGARLWMRFDKSRNTEVLECDRSAILKRVAIPARDLRILGPVFSNSSNILAREKAMIVNLEFIKAIVTAEEILLLDPMRQEVLPFVDQLKQQLINKGGMHPMDGHDTAMHISGNGKLLTNTDAPDELKTDFPFEFQVLEIALEIVCTYLDSSVVDLERNAYPILDELARSVSNKNLEHVRSLKSNLTRLLARVQKVRDEIEHLLDDNDDMAQLYLTRKWIQNQEYEAMLSNAGSNSIVPALRNLHRFGSNRSGSLITNTDDNDVEDLEMLLEAYFMQLDGTRNKILSVREYIDDTEDYVNIQLDHQRNELIQLQLTLIIAAFAIGVETLVAGMFGMNIPCQLYEINGIFEPFVGTLTAVCIVLFFVILGYARWKKLLGS